MNHLWRGFTALILLVLLSSAMMVMAQESTEEATEVPQSEATAEITETATPEATVEAVATAAPEATVESTYQLSVAGSGVVNTLVEALATASSNSVSVNTTGVDQGFIEFCSGAVDATTSRRVISAEESAICREAGVDFAELLLAYDVTVLVGNFNDTFLACLPLNVVNSVLAPSASGQVTSWGQVNLISSGATSPEATPEAIDYPAITVLVPADNTTTYAELDTLVSGVGFRSDAVTADVETILTTVSTTPGAIGVVPLSAVQSDSNVYALQIDFGGEQAGCIPPSVESAEDGIYQLATPLLMYVNRSVQPQTEAFLSFASSTNAAQAVVDSGYSPLSAVAYDNNAAILRGELDTATVVDPVEAFTIPEGIVGTVNMGGAAVGFRLADSAASRLTTNQTQLTINRAFTGTSTGIDAFCRGQLDMVFVTNNGLTADQEAVCAAANITPVTLPVGSQAAILIGHAGDTYTTCLPLAQITTIWGAGSTNTLTNWNQVSEAYPDQSMTLFGIREGNTLTDLLLGATPVRLDTEISNDPLYRAAAVGNVAGSLTYMSWTEYQDVLANNQQNIQLVGIDAGNGCVAPSVETILDGSYALSQSISLVVRQSSLATIPVQSMLWTFYNPDTATLFQISGYVGSDAADLTIIRDSLILRFAEAQAATAVAAEATPEVTPEATAESGN